jgi:alpha-L-fucosidase
LFRLSAGSFNDTKRRAFTGEDIRFTAKGSTLYAIVLAWPDSGSVTIKSLAAGSRLALRKIRKVELLGSKTRLQWSPDPSGLIVKLPAQRPCDYAFVLKISGE